MIARCRRYTVGDLEKSISYPPGEYVRKSDQVLGVCRRMGDEIMLCLFNFSEESRMAAVPGGSYLDLRSGAELAAERVALQGYGFAWLKERR